MPQEFDSKAPLPKRTGGSDYGSGLEDSGGGDDRQFAVFHGDPFKGVVKVPPGSGVDGPANSDGKLGSDIPSEVDEFTSNKVK